MDVLMYIKQVQINYVIFNIPATYSAGGLHPRLPINLHGTTLSSPTRKHINVQDRYSKRPYRTTNSNGARFKLLKTIFSLSGKILLVSHHFRTTKDCITKILVHPSIYHRLQYSYPSTPNYSSSPEPIRFPIIATPLVSHHCYTYTLDFSSSYTHTPTFSSTL